MADLAQTLINFGDGLFKLIQNDNFMYGFVLIAFGFGMFSLFLALLEKHKKFQGTKAPKAISFLITAILIGTIFRKYDSPEKFFELTNNLLSLILFLGAGIASILWGVKHHSTNKSSNPKKAKIILYFCLFFSSVVFVAVFMDDGMMSSIPLFEGINSFRETMDVLFTFVMLFSGVLLFLEILTSIFGGGNSSNSVLGKKIFEDRKEIAKFDSIVNKIKSDLIKGNDVYVKLSTRINKKIYFDNEALNILTGFRVIVEDLIKNFEEFKNINSNNIKLRITLPAEFGGNMNNSDLQKVLNDLNVINQDLILIEQELIQIFNSPTSPNNNSIMFNMLTTWFKFNKDVSQFLSEDQIKKINSIKIGLDAEEKIMKEFQEFSKLTIKNGPKKLFNDARKNFYNLFSKDFNYNHFLIVKNIFVVIGSYCNGNSDFVQKLNSYVPASNSQYKSNNIMDLVVIIFEGIKADNSINKDNLDAYIRRFLSIKLGFDLNKKPADISNDFIKVSDLKDLISNYKRGSPIVLQNLTNLVNMIKSDPSYSLTPDVDKVFIGVLINKYLNVPIYETKFTSIDLNRFHADYVTFYNTNKGNFSNQNLITLMDGFIGSKLN